jgi:dimethylaniline monooxygenase (N-oxide forming)
MAGAFLPRYQRPTPVERWLHGVGAPLVWVFWRIVELIIRVQLRLGTKIANGKDMIPSERMEVGVFGEASMLAPPEFYPLIRKGRITAHRTEIDRYTPDGVVLKDGTELGIDRVILATGWECDYGYLSDEAKIALGEEEDGFYLYRHILQPALPNLAFIGRATTFVSVLTYCLQARWLAELITGRISLPSPSAMVREIDEMKAWKRSWMPFSAARGARLFLHAPHYHDELMVDIGADPFRKRGPFAPLKELFSPYEPRDYSAIVAGSWERPDQRAESGDASTEA